MAATEPQQIAESSTHHDVVEFLRFKWKKGPQEEQDRMYSIIENEEVDGEILLAYSVDNLSELLGVSPFRAPLLYRLLHQMDVDVDDKQLRLAQLFEGETIFLYEMQLRPNSLYMDGINYLRKALVQMNRPDTTTFEFVVDNHNVPWDGSQFAKDLFEKELLKSTCVRFVDKALDDPANRSASVPVGVSSHSISEMERIGTFKVVSLRAMHAQTGLEFWEYDRDASLPKQVQDCLQHEEGPMQRAFDHITGTMYISDEIRLRKMDFKKIKYLDAEEKMSPQHRKNSNKLRRARHHLPPLNEENAGSDMEVDDLLDEDFEIEVDGSTDEDEDGDGDVPVTDADDLVGRLVDIHAMREPEAPAPDLTYLKPCFGTQVDPKEASVAGFRVDLKGSVRSGIASAKQQAVNNLDAMLKLSPYTRSHAWMVLVFGRVYYQVWLGYYKHNVFQVMHTPRIVSEAEEGVPLFADVFLSLCAASSSQLGLFRSTYEVRAGFELIRYTLHGRVGQGAESIVFHANVETGRNGIRSRRGQVLKKGLDVALKFARTKTAYDRAVLACAKLNSISPALTGFAAQGKVRNELSDCWVIELPLLTISCVDVSVLHPWMVLAVALWNFHDSTGYVHLDIAPPNIKGNSATLFLLDWSNLRQESDDMKSVFSNWFIFPHDLFESGERKVAQRWIDQTMFLRTIEYCRSPKPRRVRLMKKELLFSPIAMTTSFLQRDEFVDRVRKVFG